MPFAYPDQPARLEEVRCESARGGLLNHYHLDRKAA
jgi:hypothetical protein